MEALSSMRSIRRCAMVQRCGQRDGPDFSGAAWACLECHQNSDLSNTHPACRFGAGTAVLDYPYPLWQFALVYDFLRDNPAAGYDELRTLLGFFMLCQGAFGTFLFQDP